MTEYVETSLAIQRALRATLIADSNITALVPAANIMDRNGRPEVFPCILMGEAQVLDEPREIGNWYQSERTYSTLHIWVEEAGLETAKQIAGLIKRNIHRQRWFDVEGRHQIDCSVEQMRFLRDPNGKLSHGVLTLNSLTDLVNKTDWDGGYTYTPGA